MNYSIASTPLSLTTGFLFIKLLPDGKWKWPGYAGLASHGRTMGQWLSVPLLS